MASEDLKRKILNFLREECDGTYSEDPNSWELELRGSHGHMTVPEFVDRLAQRLSAKE